MGKILNLNLIEKDDLLIYINDNESCTIVRFERISYNPEKFRSNVIIQFHGNTILEDEPIKKYDPNSGYPKYETFNFSINNFIQINGWEKF